jgi:rhodanese-related sulfurtransferase
MRLFRKAPSAAEISPADAQSAISTGEAVLIDVREQWEWQQGHAARARHIPLGDLPHRIASLPRKQEILVICASGNRSLTAANFLQEQGFASRSVAGGIRAWSRHGLEVRR